MIRLLPWLALPRTHASREETRDEARHQRSSDCTRTSSPPQSPLWWQAAPSAPEIGERHIRRAICLPYHEPSDIIPSERRIRLRLACPAADAAGGFFDHAGSENRRPERELRRGRTLLCREGCRRPGLRPEFHGVAALSKKSLHTFHPSPSSHHCHVIPPLSCCFHRNHRLRHAIARADGERH
jgi:hypothetical protein